MRASQFLVCLETHESQNLAFTVPTATTYTHTHIHIVGRLGSQREVWHLIIFPLRPLLLKGKYDVQ